MSDLEQALEHITEQIRRYRSMTELNGYYLNECLQQITGTLFYLETERAVFHDMWQNKVNHLVLEGNSVARATNQADVEIPELYKLRRIMDGAYEVVGAIRTNISWLKNEKNNAQ